MKKILLSLLCLGMLVGCGTAGVETINGDVVKIDFVGKKDGTAFSGGTASDYVLELGSNSFIDGFEEQVVGMKTGKKKTIAVTFPSNYGNELAGQECTFDITLHNVYREINDSVTQNGDIVKIDYVGRLKGDIFNGGSANGYLLELGSGSFIPGFEDQLIGMNKNQKKTITVTFPNNYGSTEINGEEVSLSNQEVTFDVAINHIFREVK